MRVPVLFTFEVEPRGEQFQIVREVIHVYVKNKELFDALKPVAPYTKPEKRQQDRVHAEVVYSDYKPDVQ